MSVFYVFSGTYVSVFCVFSDIDECELKLDGCKHGCINEVGSFMCHCSPGYQLGTDGKSCYSE